jgi:hypothetical protein
MAIVSMSGGESRDIRGRQATAGERGGRSFETILLNSIEAAERARDLKFTADQGDAHAENLLDNCLGDGIGIPVNFEGAAHYFKLSADQGNADGKWRDGVYLRSPERDGSSLTFLIDQIELLNARMIEIGLVMGASPRIR